MSREEDLALERVYLRQARADADTLWRAGSYGLAHEMRREADDAERRIAMLEQETEA